MPVRVPVRVPGARLLTRARSSSTTTAPMRSPGAGTRTGTRTGTLTAAAIFTVAVAVAAAGGCVELVDLRSGSDAGPADAGVDAADAGSDAGPEDGGPDAGFADELVDDPFGGGTFAFVARAGDDLFVGPNPTGDLIARIDHADDDVGDAGVSVKVTLLPMLFPLDDTGDNVLRNPGAAGIGFTGCVGTACGPDEENGRGLLTGLTLGEQSLLFLSGTRFNGDFDYVYVGAPGVDSIEMRYVDLSVFFDANTHGATAAAAFQERVYVGFSDGASSTTPYVLALDGLPAAGPGVDVVTDAEQCDAAPRLVSCDLAGHEMPAVGEVSGFGMIDAIGAFADLLYLGNSEGIARATVPSPRSADPDDGHPEEWLDVTPLDARWSAHLSVATTKRADLEPPDRAIVGFAPAGIRFVVGRNTVDGPQLWTCTPAKLDPIACDALSWQLIGDDGVVDDGGADADGLTRLVPDAAAVAFVLAAADGAGAAVGFDAAGGAAIFHTVDGVRFSAVGPPGLAAAPDTRIFSALLDDDGTLYVVTGDGVGPPRLLRLSLP